jgi:hypothetical protein
MRVGSGEYASSRWLRRVIASPRGRQHLSRRRFPQRREEKSMILWDAPDLRLEAMTKNCRDVTGHALVTNLSVLSGDFALQGTGPLLVDGEEPLR